MSDRDALAHAIQVMARLRAPGGCPWDREQTHQSLAKYAIEEAHEVAEAAENHDMAGLREELGDLLLQVLFHAQIAHEAGAFSLDDVATGLVDKLTRRHPHVFGEGTASTPEQVEENWDAIKQQENPGSHPLDDIPATLPALMRAQKVISRAQKANLPVVDHLDLVNPDQHRPYDSNTAGDIGNELLGLVWRANQAGVDAEQALRHATRALRAALDSPRTS